MRVFVAVDLNEVARSELERLLKFLRKKHWAVKWEEVNKLHITLAFLGDLRRNENFKEENRNWKLEIRKIKECLKLALKRAKGTPRMVVRRSLNSSEVKELASEESIKPFTISFKGLGCFPDYDWPRIVWLGAKGDLKSLAFLQKSVREKLTEAGFKIDKKPFRPHITLGRIKKASAGQRKEIGRQIKALREMKFISEWLVDRVVVYQSRCLPQGSVYAKLLIVPLPIR